MSVARDGGKLRAPSQLALQLENPLILGLPVDLRRQVICNHPHAALGNQFKPCFFRHGKQLIGSEKPHTATIERFISPISGEALFRRLQIACPDSSF